MGADGPEPASLFRPRPATREEVALALGRSRPDPWWLTALLGAAGILLAGFLLYVFSVAASAMELKRSKGARPMRRLCRATGWVLVGIAPFCLATAVIGRLSARRKLRDLRGGFGEDFVESARFQPLDVLQLDYPDRSEPDLVFRIGETRALLLRAQGTRPGDNSLPNTDFELVRLRATRRRLRAIPHGASIDRVPRREGTPGDWAYPDGEPFDVKWSSLEKPG